MVSEPPSDKTMSMSSMKHVQGLAVNNKVINMENNLKIATWNLCLGLPNKKDIVTEYLKTNDISVCCLQETEVPNNFPTNILNCNNYNLELECSDEKQRTGIYVKNTVQYARRFDLEEKNCHIVIVDINLSSTIRIINVYRSFHPPDKSHVNDFFVKQLAVIKNALCSNCYVMGDFNLDGGPDLNPNYCNIFLAKEHELKPY